MIRGGCFGNPVLYSYQMQAEVSLPQPLVAGKSRMAAWNFDSQLWSSCMS